MLKVIPLGNTTFVQMHKEINDIEKRLNEKISVTDLNRLTLRLEQIIRHLIEHDFPLLLQCLYQVDIDEKKLKKALSTNEDAPEIVISKMMIERWKQKVEWKNLYKKDNHDIPPEESW